MPVKPFGVAKARLAGVLDATTRSRLGKAIAARTAAVAAAAGAEVAVVTADPGVARWARNLGHGVIDEGTAPGKGLDAAAAAAVATATGRGCRWAIVHADLPLATVEDLTAVFSASAGAVSLAPTHDGGTSVIAGFGPFPFAYGPASFHRHLASAPGAVVVSRPGLAHDLDTPDDLGVVLQLAAGVWLAELVPG